MSGRSRASAELNAANLGGAFVFRPGEPQPGAGVYRDWASLWADLSGSDATIYLDGSIESDGLIVSAGDYDLGRVAIIARDGESLRFAEGAIASSLPHLSVGVTYRAEGSTPCFRPTSGSAADPWLYGCTFRGTSAPCIELVDGVSFRAIMEFGDLLDAGSPAVTVAAGCTLFLVALGETDVPADVLSGAGDAFIRFDAASSAAAQSGLGTCTLTAVGNGPPRAFGSVAVALGTGTFPVRAGELMLVNPDGPGTVTVQFPVEVGGRIGLRHITAYGATQPADAFVVDGQGTQIEWPRGTISATPTVNLGRQGYAEWLWDGSGYWRLYVAHTTNASTFRVWSGEAWPTAPLTEDEHFGGPGLPDGWAEWDESGQLTPTVASGLALSMGDPLVPSLAGVFRAAPVLDTYRISARVDLLGPIGQVGVFVADDLAAAPATAGAAVAGIVIPGGGVAPRCVWAHWADYQTFTGEEPAANVPVVSGPVYVGIWVDTVTPGGLLVPVVSRDGREWFPIGDPKAFAAWGLAAAPVSIGVYVQHTGAVTLNGIRGAAAAFRVQDLADWQPARGGWIDATPYGGQEVW